MQWVDDRLRRAPSPVLEAERRRLERAYDPLWAAVEAMSALADLPRCLCGKVRHHDVLQARRHAAALYLIGRPSPMLPSVYYEHEAWHVGHSRRAARGVPISALFE